MKAFYTISFSTLLLLLSAAGQASALAKTPLQELKQTNGKINRLLAKKVKVGSPQEKKLKDEMKKLVNTFLDFEELTKRSLGKHWTERSAAERKEFVDLLRQLIERNYVKQLRGNLGYKLEYKGEKVNGNEATVGTVVKVKKNRRTTEVSIEYKMRRASKKWMVYDVITDDVSIVKNYRSQFNRIIRRKSYNALVKKLKRKLADKS